MKHLIECAMKRCACDLVIRNVSIFNVFTGQFEKGEIAVSGDRIAGIGSGFTAEEVFDGEGRCALPAFLDSHIHIESSMLSPEAFSSLVVPHGTGGVIADPHEIVNVCGIAGAEYLMEAFKRQNAPLSVFLQLPSCVPATPFETSGAEIDGRETERELSRELFFGLGEMMNFPAVLSGEGDVLQKLASARAQKKPIDGHAPGLSGDRLNAYLCGGILTDHECLTAEECREKVSRGMYVQLRCGSSAENLAATAAALDEFNFRRFLLCSDDKNARDLTQRGHMDDALSRLVRAGVPAKYAILTATLNVAECYGLHDSGALAPGKFADVTLVDDTESFNVSAVFHRGRLVAREGKALFSTESKYLPHEVRGTVRIKQISPEDFTIRGHGGRFRAMEILPRSLVTKETFVPAPKGTLDVKGTRLCKLAVIERHFASGNLGLGLVKDYGFRGGAMGISVAHDSHNLVILGDDDRAMARVAELLAKAGGGMALVPSEGEAEIFPLDIAGLMSSASPKEAAERTAHISERARAMGVRECYEPFMSLAFLSLAVIPKLKLTDKGLFDLEKYDFVPLEEL